MKFSLFISCARGLETLLADEMRSLGLYLTQITPQGVYGEADHTILYQLCLWSRLANRVQLILFSGETREDKSLYRLCQEFHWQTVFTADKTFAIDFHGTSSTIRNSMYGAQIIKDAIVDHFRHFYGYRPNVDKEQAKIRLHAYLHNGITTVSLDVKGHSLHQRGYRLQAGDAPLKETLASAMLIRANWPKLATQGYALQDPFCGAGTLVIEAAMMAAHVAPGLVKQDHALANWVNHQPSLWEKLRAAALKEVKPFPFKLRGSDSHAPLIAMAKENAGRAGVLPLVEFIQQDIKDCKAINNKGLLITNPPYGERLGEMTSLISLYQQFGLTLHTHFKGWQAAFLTANPILAKAIGLRSAKQYSFFNGSLECKLYCVDLATKNQLKSPTTSSDLQMLINRLQKNYLHLKKWAKREQVFCYRVYDADLPQYAYAIDLYNEYAILQEYQAPAAIAAHLAEKRSLDVIKAVPIALGIAPDKLVIKQRRRQKGNTQYEKISETAHDLIIQEGQAKFKVNLYDYLDTGLFLDHRLLRLHFAKLEPGKHFLNCFCYTGTASVHAALAGALTTNIDLSKNYLKWAEENFRLNELKLTRHQFIHDDCLKWLERARGQFDIIFLDPPTFSNSKRMTSTLDIQRDHPLLINAAMRLLAPNGVLYFSTNLRHFKLEETLKTKYMIQNITTETIDIDFKRNPRIHQCFKLWHDVEKN